MQITGGCGKGGFSPAALCREPQFRRRKFSPFTFTLTRQDGEANPQTIALHLPQGLLAKLGGVPLCPDAAAATGACPAASKIGSPHRRHRGRRGAALDPPAGQGPDRRLPRGPL